jgi:hypothetical protein
MSMQPEISITADAGHIAERLAEPFDVRALKLKPGPGCNKTPNNNALGIVYVDARVIMDRLDAVMGVGGWRDEYDLLPSGQVICRLSLKIGGEWVTKSDVGGQSEQPDDGDKMKAAFSDALKRAAVKFGVARYIYFLPAQWLPWDGRKFTKPPTLPPWALPGQRRPALSEAPPASRPKELPAAPAASPKPNGRSDSSVAGNSLPAAQQDAARQANPRPVTDYCTPEAASAVRALGDQLRLKGPDWTEILTRYKVKRITHLTAPDAAALSLELSREVVRQLLSNVGYNLDDVRKLAPAFAGDLPDDLDQGQCDVAISVLRNAVAQNAVPV